MRFRVLGPLEVDAGNGPVSLGGPKQRAVLALLLIRANELVPAETLIDELWGEDPPAQARNTLQGYVSHLRKAVGAARIQSQTPGYRLSLDPSELDAARFDILLRDARRTLPRDPHVAASLLDEALTLWHGNALSDVAQEGSLLAEAARLDELKLVATEERIDALLAIGEHARVIGEIEARLRHHPLRERIWGQLMVALYREGRQADALNAFQRAREILADELGIDPSPELTRLQDRILQQDPSLDLRGEPLRGYRLLEKIDDGSVGTVFRAIQPQVGRDVVVKVFHERVGNDPEFVRRFDPEAQAVASLEHPHLVPLYDYWREPSGAYVVSRYLRGGTLRSLLDRGDPLDAGRAMAILEQVASGLAFAHRQGIAHGAVRPSNVLLDDEGNAYLGDFRIGMQPAPDPVDDIGGLATIARALLPSVGAHPLAEMLERAESGVERPTAQELLDATRIVAPVAEATPGSPDTRNPYKGLRPFSEADARDFFGRRGLVERLLARCDEPVRSARFLAVVGPSGSGKSSVVRAGLVPAIRGGAVAGPSATFVAEMLPGAHPLEELESALIAISVGPVAGVRDRLESGSRGLIDAVELILPPEAEAVLVVDQFEEVFTLVRDMRERELFLEQLRVAAVDPESRVRVIITLRADFYDRPLLSPRFGELLAERTEAVTTLTPDELERAISGPAQAVGVTPEPGLVAEMIADVSDQPGALPLVQYALTELFERRDAQRMTLAAYREIGGVAGALSARADRLIGSTGPDGRRATKQVFLRLVTLGEGRQDTRRRVARSELASLELDLDTIEAVLEAYGRHRLLTFDREPSTREPTVEIAHEALLDGWTTLRRWIDAAREDLRQERALARAAAEWRASDRDASFLLRGTRLQLTEAWAAATDLAIGIADREFLKASVVRREADEAVERERRVREAYLERRSRIRLRALVAVLAAAALVASTLTIVAVRQRGKAAQQSRIAFARELAAASAANLESDGELAVLLALEATNVTREHDGSVLPEAEEALHRALAASRVVRSFRSRGDMIDWSPDGTMFVTEGVEESGLVTVRDARTGEHVTPAFPAHDPDVNGVVFSDDSSMLATTGDDGDVRVWDPRTGEELLGYNGDPGIVQRPSFSPDGTLVAAPFRDEASIRIWDITTGEMLHEIRQEDAGFATSFSPDDRRMAFATWSSGAIVVDLRTGRRVMQLDNHGDDGVQSVDWSPNGRSIATSGDDGTVTVWDAATGEARGRLYVHRSGIVHSEWSPDSSRIVTGSIDGTAKLWEILPDGGRELLTISGQGTGVWVWPTFSPDGTQVMTGGGASGTLRIWDVGRAGDAEWTNVPSDETFPGVAFTSDGEAVISSNGDGTVTLWDAETGEGIRALGRAADDLGPAARPDPWSAVFSMDVSPQGAVAVAEFEPAVNVWDESTGDELFTLTPRRTWFSNVAWSQDGSFLAAVNERSTAIIDRGGEEVATVREEEGFVALSAAFSPDGTLLATAREWSPEDRPNPETVRVTVWDWRTGDVVQTLPAGFPLDVDFDPSGTRLAVGTRLGTAEIYDVASGRRLATLVGPSGEVWFARWSPDGSTLATSGTDGVVRLWDPTTGTLRFALYGHAGEVTGLAFSPDGSKLATSAVDGTVRVWALDLGDLIRIARGEVQRGLTEAECRQYLHVSSCPTTGEGP